ncbi:hypothetical protein [Microbacterium rhizophilus]|uniref:hypothetical protein n=1 Tax=Microbacterium rhizophilus TaxID=3138934 RepID=UPI0031E88214
MLHWIAGSWALLVLSLAALVPSLVAEDPVRDVAALLAGAAACLLGAVATSSVRGMRLSDDDFIRGTSTIRTIEAAWLLMITLVGVSVFAEIPALEDAAYGMFLQLVGWGSLIALIGPGYSEYRSARAASAARASAAASSPQP